VISRDDQRFGVGKFGRRAAQISESEEKVPAEFLLTEQRCRRTLRRSER